MTRTDPIPAVLMRGGTSKGVFLHGRDLPPPGPERDDLLLRIMGTPDPMQIDGLGGTYSSTSKVIVVEPRTSDSVEYWFAQIGVAERTVDWSGNCGNLTSAVGPFAIDEGLVTVEGDSVALRLHNGNTGVVVETLVQVEGGRAATRGDLAIAGVPGTGSPVVTRYLEPAGGVLDALLPTGSPLTVLDPGGLAVEASIVDVTHPYVFVDASSAGLADDDRRTPDELNSDPDLLARVELLRAHAAVRVGVTATVEGAAMASPIVPRIVLVHRADDADIRVTAFSMGKAHRSIPMTAALCIAAAARLDGTVVSRAVDTPSDEIRIRHPRGVASAVVEASGDDDDPIRSVGVVRTARRLMDGHVYPRAY